MMTWDQTVITHLTGTVSEFDWTDQRKLKKVVHNSGLLTKVQTRNPTKYEQKR